MFKNTSGQKIRVFAFNTITNTPETGDAANITAYISKDYGSLAALNDTVATEQDSVNAKGFYIFDLTQAETNADVLDFSAKSSTADIEVIPVYATIYTRPPYFSTTNIDSSGRVAVNVVQISGDTTAADNAEAFFDGTGYAGTNNVIPTVTTLTNLPAITAGWLTATGIAADAITAAKLAADVTTELQSGLATAAALTSAQSDITAIKAKTDPMTYTVANQLNANTKSINDTTVIGTGITADKWRA